MGLRLKVWGRALARGRRRRRLESWWAIVVVLVVVVVVVRVELKIIAVLEPNA
jgi:hypothetical protein